jgi:hypothetical protein
MDPEERLQRRQSGEYGKTYPPSILIGPWMFARTAAAQPKPSVENAGACGRQNSYYGSGTLLNRSDKIAVAMIILAGIIVLIMLVLLRNRHRREGRIQI